jgi:hypothetical protein
MLGRVRLAKNVNTAQLAAVKIVPKSATPTAKRKDTKEDKTADTGLSYSIEREVVIMKLIEHPNVMRLYDVWENRGELYDKLANLVIVDISYWSTSKAGSCSIISLKGGNSRRLKPQNTSVKSSPVSPIAISLAYGMPHVKQPN